MNNNIHTNKISVIGGDLRQLYMIEELSKSNSEVYSFGLPKSNYDEINVFCCNSLEQSLSYADNIILPLPVSNDDKYIISPLSSEKILIDDIISFVKNKDKLILLGKASDNVLAKFMENKIRVIDYFNNEQLNIQNAILTAEGAIELAIKKTEISVYSSKCLVTGYGRIAKILSKILLSMGADVTVAARKSSDLIWAEANGFHSIKISDILDHANNFDIIFNTVPSRIIEEDVISKFKKDSLIIELASYPYGMDPQICKDYQLKYINAASLPGKTAPKSAGIIICKTAINIFKEENRWKT